MKLYLTILAVFVAAVAAGLAAWQSSRSIVSGVLAAFIPIMGALPSPVFKPKPELPKPPAAPLTRLGVALPLLFLGAFTISACGPVTWKSVTIRGADTVDVLRVKTIPPLMAAGALADEKKCVAEHPAGYKRSACMVVIIKRLAAWKFARAIMGSLVLALKNIYDAKPAPGAQPKVKPDPSRPRAAPVKVDISKPPKATPVTPAPAPARR